MSTYYSTAEVAEMLKIEPITLYRWMRGGKIPRPSLRKVGRVSVRLWTEAEVAKARRYKAKFYWKGRGRKKGSKSKT